MATVQLILDQIRFQGGSCRGAFTGSSGIEEPSQDLQGGSCRGAFTGSSGIEESSQDLQVSRSLHRIFRVVRIEEPSQDLQAPLCRSPHIELFSFGHQMM